MLAGTGRPSPSVLADVEATLERLLGPGRRPTRRSAAALNEVLDSLRTLIERLIADPARRARTAATR